MSELEEIKEGNGQLSIELDEQIAQGVYANLAIINHSATEFVVDFVSVMPGMPKGKVRSRVILTPEHAKRLLGALAENIRHSEDAHGMIAEKSDTHTIPLFGITGEA